MAGHRKKNYPHYRLEDTTTGLGIADTASEPRLVKPEDADTFPSSFDAVLASAGRSVELVKVVAP